jgi:hypothetical protein
MNSRNTKASSVIGELWESCFWEKRRKGRGDSGGKRVLKQDSPALCPPFCLEINKSCMNPEFTFKMNVFLKRILQQYKAN